MPVLRHIFIAMIAVATAAPLARAQEPADTLVTEPKWEVGQRFDVTSVKTKSKLLGDRVVSSQTGRLASTIEVTEVNDERVVLVWTHGETAIGGPLKDDPTLREMANMWKGQRMVLVFDAQTHGFVRIDNFDEVMKKLEATLAKLGEMLIDVGTPRAQVDRILAGVRQMFANPDAAGALLIKDLGGLVGFFGRELDPDHVVEYELEFPNPFGGPPIPATEVWLSPKRVGDGEVYDIEAKQAIDVDSFAASVAEWAQAIVPDRPEARDKMIAAMNALRIDTGMTFRYDAERGFFTDATMTRRVSSGEQGQIEKIVWTMTPAKADD